MSFPVALSHRTMADPMSASIGTAITAGEADWLTESFNEFFRKKVPTPQAYANARMQANDIVHSLRSALYPQRVAMAITGDSLIVGSVGKRTALAPIASVDVLYLLPTKLRVSRSADAFKVIEAGLSAQFDEVDIETDSIGVCVKTGFMRVRLIPAVEGASGYRIPQPVSLDHASGWRIANPIAEAATLRLSDSLYSGATRRLLTLLKSWRENRRVDIPSIALEVLVQEYFATQQRQAAIQADFKAFMTWSRSKTPGPVKVPGARTSLQVDEAWHGSAKAAFWRTTLAEQSVSSDPQKTSLEWRHLLGLDFPVPEESGTSIPPILEACA